MFISSPLSDVETVGSQGHGGRRSGAAVSGGGGGILGAPGMRGMRGAAAAAARGGGRHARLETPLERSMRRSQRLLFWAVSAAAALLAILVIHMRR